MKKLWTILIVYAITVCSVSVSADISDTFATRIQVYRCLADYVVMNNSALEIGNRDLTADFLDTGKLSADDKRYLSFLLEQGVVHGYEDNTLRLDNNITRLEVAVLLERANGFFSEKTVCLEYKHPYSDVPDWGREAVRYCYERGLMIGYANAFGCNDNITTQQMNTLLRRLRDGITKIEKFQLLEAFGECNLRINLALRSADTEQFNIGKGDFTFEGSDTPQELIDFAQIEPISKEQVDDFNHQLELRFQFDYQNTDINKIIQDTSGSNEGNFYFAYFNEMKNKHVRQDVIFVTGNAASGMMGDASICKGYLYFIRYEGENVNIGNMPQFDIDISNDSIIENGKWYRRKVKLFYNDRTYQYSKPNGYAVRFSYYKGSTLGPVEPVPEELLYNPQ